MSSKAKWKREFSFVRSALDRCDEEERVGASWIVFIAGDAIVIDENNRKLDIYRRAQKPDIYNRAKAFDALKDPRDEGNAMRARLFFERSRKHGFKLP